MQTAGLDLDTGVGLSLTLVLRACLAAPATFAVPCAGPVPLTPVTSHSSPKSRKDFLKAVHSVLRDKHRRQLLKAESLPSSQQYVPFGGKRLCALKGARPAMSRAGTVGVQAAGTPPPPRHCRAEGAAVLVGET